MALSASTSTLAQALWDHTVDPDYSASHSAFLSPSTAIVESGPSSFSAKTTLPGSIMPSDVPSLVGSSIPTTLIMDTEAAPSTHSAIPTTATAATDTGSRARTTSWAATTLTQGSPTLTQTVTVSGGVAASVTPNAGVAPDKVSIAILGLCLAAGVAAQM